MIKNHALAGAIVTFLAAADIAYAPAITPSCFNPSPSTIGRGEGLLEKFAREHEEKIKLTLEKLEDSERLREMEKKKTFLKFPYQNELSQILKHSQIAGIEPELLMAIRLAENGKDNVAYGIIPYNEKVAEYQNDTGYQINGQFYSYKNIKEKQLRWAAITVQFYKKTFAKNQEGYNNFITYLASKYAPIGAKNDPQQLNRNWERNVKNYYSAFKN